MLPPQGKQMEVGSTPELNSSSSESELAEGEFLRIRLRDSLRGLRKDAGLTQSATADRLDWSTSKVVRIENGDVPVAPSDVSVMLSTFGVDDEDITEELVQLARDARAAKKWAEYDDVVSPALKDMIAREARASSIRKFEPSVIPGYFQTSAYSSALLTHLGYSKDDANRRIEIRIKRQQVIDLNDHPDMHVIIGEAALIRAVGGADTMRDQIAKLAELSRQSAANLYLLPFSAGAHPAMDSAFTVVRFNGTTVENSLYLFDAFEHSTSPEDVEEYLELFDFLRDLAEGAASFEEQIQRIAEELYSSGGG